jgi:sugar phosphate isomerase/epimerase
MCPATLIADFMNPTGDDVRAAVDSALRAGATTSSTWTLHLPALGGLEAAADWLKSAGMATGCVEAGSNWANTDQATADKEGRQLAEAAAALESPLIMAVCLEPALDDMDQARDNLAVMAAHARDAGARVCVEFLPWTGIANLATAWALVEPLGPDAGVLVDTWHWQRQPGGPNLPLLSSIPGDRVLYVQMCDAAPGSSTDMAEAMTGRLLPGDGVVDFASLIATLKQIDAHPFIAPEIFNPGLVAELGADAFASAGVSRSKQLFDSAA